MLKIWPKMILIITGLVLLQSSQGYSESYSRLKRSVGGLPTQIVDHPYMASLRSAGGHYCGGTILSESIILTAGHCILPDLSLDLLYVKVGDADINYKGSWHSVAKMIKHEEFKRLDLPGGNQGYNDVALLKLENPIAIDNVTTRVVKLFDEDENVQDYDKGEVVGWGVTPVIVTDRDKTGNTPKIAKKKIQRYPPKLVHVELNVAPHNKCFELMPEADLEGQFCTYTLGKAACPGDSGGPFMIDGRQAGIASWAHPNCFLGQTYTYFVNIAKFRSWIDDHMKILSEQT